VKFTEKGSVTLRGFMADDGEHLVIEVSDTGIGIAPELRGRVFGAFEQGMDSVSVKPNGFGLGLPIAYHLTRLLGGTIDLHSEPGKGTIGIVTIPVSLRVGPER